MICLATASWTDHGTRCGFHFVEWTVKPSRKWSVTPITCVSLCAGHRVLLDTVVTVAYRMDAWVRGVVCFSSGSFHSIFQY